MSAITQFLISTPTTPAAAPRRPWDGTVLAGSLEPRALQFVREWARLRSAEIQANWDRAGKDEVLLSIVPLP
ncbi:MAG: hypothetical protein ACRDPO_05730 [Streptosporangiaceae bacterium]